MRKTAAASAALGAFVAAASAAGQSAPIEIRVTVENLNRELVTDLRAIPAGAAPGTAIANRFVDAGFVLPGRAQEWRLDASAGCRYHVTGRTLSTGEGYLARDVNLCLEPTIRFVPLQNPIRPVENRSSLQLVGTGTGFIVSSRGHVLTNQHIVARCTVVTFRFNQASAIMETQASEPGADLALLRVPARPEVLRTWAAPGPRAAMIAPGIAEFSPRPSVSYGEAVSVFGFPLYGTLDPAGVIVDGVVNALQGAKPREPGAETDIVGVPAPERFQMSAPIQRGNSGSPVMDAAGNVVGVAAAALRTELGAMSFAVKHDVAMSFLEGNEIRPIKGEPGRVRPLPMIAEQARAIAGMVECWR